MELFEFLEQNKKHTAKEGDIVVVQIAGHCGASCAYAVWILPQELEAEVRRRVDEYTRAKENDDEFCPHCGLSRSLQWERYIVRTITPSILQQAEELETSVEDLFKDLYTT